VALADDPAFTLVTAARSGRAGNGASAAAAVSAGGRSVVFRSEANDLVAGARSGTAAVYVRDLAMGRTRLVGVVWAGGLDHLAHDDAPAISGDGRVVAFRSVSGGVDDGMERQGIFAREGAGPLAQVDLGIGGAAPDGMSAAPALSRDGRFVAFHTWAGNLVAGDDNRRPDVFVHDRKSGATRLASARPDGRPGQGASVRPWLSADGRFVAFESDAPDLVGGDDNGRVDVFVRDLAAGVTERVSVASSGREGTRDSHDAVISADGRYVAFASSAPELSPSAAAWASAIYVRDRAWGVTELVTVPLDGGAWRDSADHPALSPDGCCVAFRSTSRLLAPGKTDDEPEIFVYDRRARAIRRHRPVQADDTFATPPELARGALADGSQVLAFTTGRALVAGDRNTVADVYALVERVAEGEVFLPWVVRGE